jgi:hypothetical protein
MLHKLFYPNADILKIFDQSHHCAVCSRVRFSYKKQCVELFAKIFEKKLVVHRCQ